MTQLPTDFPRGKDGGRACGHVWAVSPPTPTPTASSDPPGNSHIPEFRIFLVLEKGCHVCSRYRVSPPAGSGAGPTPQLATPISSIKHANIRHKGDKSEPRSGSWQLRAGFAPPG